MAETLPPVILPVELTCPIVSKLPPDTLPVTVARPLVDTLPAVTLAVLVKYPVIFAPVLVIVTVVAPPAPSVKLPALTTLPDSTLVPLLVTVIPG